MDTGISVQLVQDKITTSFKPLDISQEISSFQFAAHTDNIKSNYFSLYISFAKMADDGDVYAQQAKKLVDDVIELAIRRLETNVSLMSEKEKTFESLKFSEMSRETTFVREDDYVIDNITWLSIGEFTVELAEKKIDEFVKVRFCMKRSKSLLH